MFSDVHNKINHRYIPVLCISIINILAHQNQLMHQTYAPMLSYIAEIKIQCVCIKSRTIEKQLSFNKTIRLPSSSRRKKNEK